MLVAELNRGYVILQEGTATNEETSSCGLSDTKIHI
jgi:hypothetical protein